MMVFLTGLHFESRRYLVVALGADETSSDTTKKHTPRNGQQIFLLQDLGQSTPCQN
jgi:hypothetical protein